MARWSALAMGSLAAATTLASLRMSSAHERPADPESSAGAGSLANVGVWVEEGSSASRLESGRSGEASASATSAGTSSAVAVRAVVKGKAHDVLTNAATVGELLSAMGVNPDADDRVLPPPSTPLQSGIDVRFDGVRVFQRVIRRPIPPTPWSAGPGARAERADDGTPGLVLETYRVRRIDGRVVSRKLIRKRVVRPAVPPVLRAEVGDASWYYTPGAELSAASPSLPFGTHVTVTNLRTGESVNVVIDDRGPFGGRIIDLSPEAFSSLASLGTGVIPVRLTW
jgi:rare lipoprotein A